jgi:hypothetical protein
MSGTESQTPADEGRPSSVPAQNLTPTAAQAAAPAPTRTAKPGRSRRLGRGTLALIVAASVAAATAVVGYASQYRPVVAPPAAVAPVPGAPAPNVAPGGPAIGTVIMVIRHGEKPDDEGSLPGVDVNGADDESSLTRVGWNRANALVNFFDPAQGPIRPGLARPAAIFAAGANEDGEGKRTRETIGPLAHKLGIQMDTSYGKGDEESLIAAAASRPGPTLICWQHGEIPAIAEAFGSVTPTPPQEWPDERFDVVWTFTKTATGWNFAEVPEMLLPGDQASTIGGGGLFSASGRS